MNAPPAGRRGFPLPALAAWLFPLCLALAGCADVSVHHDPKADLSRYRRFYVERRLGDDHHLDELLVQELRDLGREATSGPLTMRPDGVDASVTYTDRWAWDFKTYLIEFNFEVRDARTDKLLTTGRYYQPTLRSKAPVEMIRELLTPLFGRGTSPAKK